uniref:Uncharacterized protein n=1 Tax=Micrurus corallinus TaxID=54390 RepID=A0A2D4EVX1_MICCO
MTNWNNIYNILMKQTKILKEMTSIAAASLSGKAGKKPIPVATTPTTTQKKPEETQVAGKQNPAVNIQTQSTSDIIQEMILKLQETMMKKREQIRMKSKKK